MNLSDLPEIKIIRHASAKQMRLRVYPNQIKLTVPKVCSQRYIQDFLNQSEEWLLETWEKTKKKPVEIPDQIVLFNRSTPLQICVREQKMPYFLDELANIIFLHRIEALKDFILFYAKKHLTEYLKQISLETNMLYHGSQVRWVKSRWGSCNQQHKIMLNAILVLLPINLVRYVCVHELAHTIYFNHSSLFWKQVEKYDDHYSLHRKSLKLFHWPHWLL